MKCIVTGGAGFIGSHIVDQLISMGSEVVVIDNESAASHEQFYHNKNASYYEYDIAEYDLIRPLFNDVDYVFHLAAEARIQPAIQNPLLCVRTNVMGTAVVLQSAREANVRRVIYSSTSSAYGRKNIPPLLETMQDDCLTPYSVAKVSGEKMCKMYSDLFGLETITLRYFNVYGDREPTKGQYAPVIGLFLRQNRANEPLTIVGDGEQRRDFTHISDVVNANILAMQTTLSEQDMGTVFNIGTGVNYSIIELAKLISHNIKYIPPRVGESQITLADITKSKNILSWSPTKKIEDYIKESL